MTAFGELESLRAQVLSQSVRLFVEYTSVRHTHWSRKDIPMVESMVELLFGLFWGALTLLIIFCIVGSIVAAL